MKRYILAVIAVLAAPTNAQSVKTGIEAWSRADYGAALEVWRPLAARGNPDAMFNLGQAYRLGRGVPIDLTEAQGWYDRAAQAGHVDAQTQLGMLLFQNGNRVAGLRWLRSAADRGEARAQLLYGTALFNGDGIARDPLAAYRYVSRSAAQGLAPAQRTLAQLDDVMPGAMRQQALAAASAPPPAAAIKRSRVAMSAPTALAPTSPPILATGNWRIQLGAFTQRAGAEAQFRKYATGPLSGRQEFLVTVGAVTRLQAGPFASRAEAAAACSALSARGQACFVIPAGR